MNLKNLFTLFTNNRLLTVIFFFLSVTAFYGCNKNNELEDEARRQEEAYNRQLGIDTVLIKNYIATNNITNAQRSRFKSGIFYSVQTPGTGDSAAIGKTVVTHYILRDLQGKEIDTSRNPRTNPSTGQTVIQPYSFLLGDLRASNSPIVGYHESVLLMRVGERATFFLPSGVAYGERGSGTSIPPNTNLIFDIELLQVR